jgi:putative transposase
MARLLRISPAGVPVHVIQRGNNRQVCFESDDDHEAYAGWLAEYSHRYSVDIHAWVLMSNHVHLLCTPRVEGGISRMMQGLGRRYVQYFNSKYGRTGTLWNGRFKSCLIQEERYLLQVYKYIELNPVRAGMVADPGAYRWSSYQVNGLGEVSYLCTPHEEYLSLGKDAEERQRNYREFLFQNIDEEVLKEIRTRTHQGMAVGNDQFKEEIWTLTGRRLKPEKRGRPVGWRKERG